MLFKFGPHILLVFTTLMLTAAPIAARYPPFCPECEDEVWEEVPCDEIANATSPTTGTSTTTASPLPPSTIAPITSTTTSAPRYTKKPPPPSNKSSTSPAGGSAPLPTDTFQRCYCECKVGCKSFCRKVVINGDANKEITQITKTTQQVPSGQVEAKHIHELKFVPSTAGNTYPVENSEEAENGYELPKLPYKAPLPAPPPPLPQPPQLPPQLPPLSSLPPLPPPLPYPSPYPLPPYPPTPYLPPSVYEDSKATTYYPDAYVETSYSVDELTRLLQAESLNKIATYSYSPLASAPPYPYYGSPPDTPNYSHRVGPAPPSPDDGNYGKKPAPYDAGVLSAKTESGATLDVGSPGIDYGNYIGKPGANPPRRYASPATQEENCDQNVAPSHYKAVPYDAPMENYLNGYANVPGPYAAPPGHYSSYPSNRGMPY